MSNSIRVRFSVVLGAITLMGLVGCASSPPPASSDDPQAITDMNDAASATPDAVATDTTAQEPAIRLADEGSAGPDAAPADAKAVARVTLVDLPLNVSLEPAWSVVDEDVFPAVTRGVWASNGLRIGLLSRDKLGTFLEAIPPHWGDRRQRIWAGDVPVVLASSRALKAEFFADLTVPPFASQREPIRGHKAQLLMEMRPQRGGFTRVTLTPHHHQPRQTLRPRGPQEKLLDGRIFAELSVTVAVPEEGSAARYLVLGLARDERTLPPEQRGLPEANEEAQPLDNSGASPGNETARVTMPEALLDLVMQNDQGLPEGDRVEPPALGGVRDERVEPLPLNLGRALMTTGVRGAEAQVLMILEIRGLRE